MSRNFELLRQASWGQEFFQDLPSEVRRPEAAQRRPKRFSLGNDQISRLVQRIFLDPRSSHIRSVMFTANSRRVGCTWTCVQTAQVLATSVEGTVCAVDTNSAAPALSKHFATQMQQDGRAEPSSSERTEKSPKQVTDNLWFVSVGNPVEKMDSLCGVAQLGTRLRELRQEFDYLIVDAPPVRTVSAVTGSAVDGAVLVVESGAIGPKSVLDARRQLDRVQIPLLGVVLNQGASALPSVLNRLMR